MVAARLQKNRLGVIFVVHVKLERAFRNTCESATGAAIRIIAVMSPDVVNNVFPARVVAAAQIALVDDLVFCQSHYLERLRESRNQARIRFVNFVADVFRNRLKFKLSRFSQRRISGLGNLSTKNRLTDRFLFLCSKTRQVSLDRLFSGRKVKRV